MVFWVCGLGRWFGLDDWVGDLFRYGLVQNGLGWRIWMQGWIVVRLVG